MHKAKECAWTIHELELKLEPITTEFKRSILALEDKSIGSNSIGLVFILKISF